MFQVGIDARTAVATNMFARVFMSIGGPIPFIRAGRIDVRKVSPLLAITAVSSAIGALLVGIISDVSLKLIITIAMFALTVFILLGFERRIDGRTSRYTLLTFALTFALGIYGGLFSGGYVTVLTVVLAAFFGMTFSESVASTKLINVVSSSIATAVFMWQGLVDYRLGATLGVTMFVAGYIGAHFAAKLNDKLLKYIFLAAVLLLAAKTLFDLIR
jgi:uncharacterized membrane protein YfcA